MESAPVDVEAARLSALAATVFENAHYHHKCNCPGCRETRNFLGPEDQDFIDSLSQVMDTRHDPTPRR